MAKTTTQTVLVSSGSQSAGGGPTRGRVDLSGEDGGIVTWAITNGATGPTVQCVVRILVSHKAASMPAAASEGTGDDDWKLVWEQGGGTANNAKTRGAYRFGREVKYLEIEFANNTGQAVTIEAHCSSYH